MRSSIVIATLAFARIAAAEDSVSRRLDRGPVLGFELGYGAPGGTSGEVYRGGFGTGFVFGYHFERFTVEWHFHHSHRVSARQTELRAETTQGDLEFNAVLARIRLVDAPILVEAIAGPGTLSVPQLRIGEDDMGNPLVDTKGMRGLGLVVGGFVGHRLNRYLAFGVELRATAAAIWEMPGDAYVVPGDRTGDGGLMFTESAEDASGKPWSATAVMRILL